MSFSQDVKQELSKQVDSARHCNLAELAAIFSISGEVLKEEETGIFIRTENIAIARKSFTLLKKAFNINVDVSVHVHKSGKKSDRIYTVMVKNPEDALQVLMALKMADQAVFLAGARTVDPILVQQSCCKRAFIRGSFLCAGSISNPEKSYHFEIVCASVERAEQLQVLIRPFGPDARIVQRKNHYVVYLKEGDQIVDILNIMGAYVSLMNLENIRILRDVRNTVNRKVNCEAANINKTVNASVRQVEEIRYLDTALGLENLPEGLEEIARLRLDNPDASLKELGEMASPPIGKSGVNHRLRKLSRLAQDSKEGIL